MSQPVPDEPSSPTQDVAVPFTRMGPRPPMFPIGWSLNDEENGNEVESGVDEGTEGDDNSESSESEDETSLGKVRSFFETGQLSSVFACGGSIPISDDEDKQDSPSKSPSPEENTVEPTTESINTTSPVTLRWDPLDPSNTASQCKMTFPVGLSSNSLDFLISDMQPATFGMGGKDVYDETYRKALSLDPSRFSTNFCPYTTGIIDAISRILLPDPITPTRRTIKAELYKLNLYSGPSGHFRSHVDTPRSRSQIASLVVCLPFDHEGGALEVRHEGESVKFDWALGMKDGSSKVQWAAFFSDCEHEVFPVESGHRLTLTYNLYVHEMDPSMKELTGVLDMTPIPIYRYLKDMLDDETFLPDGGYLGFYTTHAYPHTSTEMCLTSILKGVDMAVWQAFQALGCGVCLRPVLDGQGPFDRPPRYSIGTSFEVTTGWMVEDEKDWDMMVEDWGLETVKWDDVLWLNSHDSDNRQPSLAYIVYGNQASAELAYSFFSIVIGVPRRENGERLVVGNTFTSNEVDWDIKAPYE